MLPETRHSLIARLKRPEDTATWQEFLATYEAAIVRYCRSRGLQDADAVEVCQDVLLAVHGVAERWEPSGRPGSFRAWLFETARRSCLKALRARRSEFLTDEDADGLVDDSPEPFQKLIHQETADWQQWAFYAASGVVQSEVDESTWRSFWMTAVENRSAKEVADELQIGIGSVYTAKCRVMGRIRKRVEELSTVLSPVNSKPSP
ncbi:MAG: sigma-70 family RNA polymerase sigma factor [Planctomycetota bacterium]